MQTEAGQSGENVHPPTAPLLLFYLQTRTLGLLNRFSATLLFPRRPVVPFTVDVGGHFAGKSRVRSSFRSSYFGHAVPQHGMGWTHQVR